MFKGKINYKWAIFNSKQLNYQRVETSHTNIQRGLSENVVYPKILWIIISVPIKVTI